MNVSRPFQMASRRKFGRKKQGLMALQAAKELLRMMGIESETVDADAAFGALDELAYSQPQSTAYLWWQSASEREIDWFIDAWADWREEVMGRCSFCLSRLVEEEVALCSTCQDFFGARSC
ncbi:hypothetical protein KDA_36290 [Dictyobacter alpinus]|uniref:Uncharacterized protein n=1 Tax=Dictyobacter alpinus TaxID=2014873 RepID=A0A402B9W4_9CHLR|nr:hypothetical protein [Dictyobacter alpinus]GCE28145.1 hypothetical protein KDA_36290 [Dictyobacter alpinus]